MTSKTYPTKAHIESSLGSNILMQRRNLRTIAKGFKSKCHYINWPSYTKKKAKMKEAENKRNILNKSFNSV